MPFNIRHLPKKRVFCASWTRLCITDLEFALSLIIGVVIVLQISHKIKIKALNSILMAIFVNYGSMGLSDVKLDLDKKKPLDLKEIFSPEIESKTESIGQKLGRQLLGISKAIGSNQKLQELAASQSVDRDALLTKNYWYMQSTHTSPLDSKAITSNFQNTAVGYLQSNYIESANILQRIRGGADFSFNPKKWFSSESANVVNPSEENKKIKYHLQVKEIAMTSDPQKFQALNGSQGKKAFLNADRAQVAWEIVTRDQGKASEVKASSVTGTQMTLEGLVQGPIEHEKVNEVFHRPTWGFTGNVAPKSFGTKDVNALSIPALKITLAQEQKYYSLELGTKANSFEKESIGHQLGLPLGHQTRVSRIFDEKFQGQEFRVDHLLYFDHAPQLNIRYLEYAMQGAATLAFTTESGVSWNMEYIGKPTKKSPADFNKEKIGIILNTRF